ncbi:MAG: sigma 54-interacting transcriptional regulator, partial [Lutispora sp.]|nr:sigma 54-interacting transcriptional regulator [Lutispora sp.]
ADYASNPQLLISHLFGHKKGSFTNAINDKAGLVEMAHNGILFLDEVHRLPPEGQEMLFYLIDKKKYKKLGESKEEVAVNVRIIAATTEDIDSSILFTFKRRFPVIIKLPRLDERSMEERLIYVKRFFFEESCKINMPIKLHESAVKAFMFYKCTGNIGQLIADIQVACSKGYLNYLNSKVQYINISLSDLPEYVQNGYPNINTQKQYENLQLKEIIITPSNEFKKSCITKSQYILGNNIYRYIEKRLEDLKSKETPGEDIDEIMAKELEGISKMFISNVTANEISTDYDLYNVIGERAIKITKSMMEIVEKFIDNIHNTLFSCLAFHLSATLDRIDNNKPIINMQLKHIKEKLKKEYKIAEEMVACIGEKYGIFLPEDEIGFIALYIYQICTCSTEDSKRVSVIVATHGSAAQSIVDVANTLVGVKHAKPLIMSLDENFDSILKRGIELVKNSDEGKGFVLLSDMGSLCFLAELISKELEIPSVSFDRVDTLMVIEVLRKAILPGTDLKTIESISLNSKKLSVQYTPIESMKSKSNKVILSLCITGEGAANKIKELIEASISEIRNKVDIITIGALSNPNIHEFIKELNLKLDVIAIVGTINPNYEEIPYISLNELIRGEGIIKLKQLLNTTILSNKMNNRHVNKFSQFIYNEAIWPKTLFETKIDVLDKISDELYSKGFVTNNFKIKVYERELLGDTIYKNSIAIPHATPNETIKPVLGILTLKKPVLWAENYYANIVFFLILKEDSSEIINALSCIANDKALLENIANADAPKDINKILSSGGV